MPNSHQLLPKLRHHKPSGRAVVRLDGSDIYLGPWGAAESRERYDRVIAEWLRCGRRLNKGDGVPSVGEVMVAYLKYAKTRYIDEYGTQKSEVNGIKNALRPVRALFESLPVYLA
ncbi:MAG: hypothetical protein AB7N71_11190 [Phycisphaerae bacterium]